ncbi:MAG: hypothetical protein M3Z03_12290, partial [Actinomycetota bacterium]|nr:hypothetical protein [Actinomycetota bacterium]
MPGSANPIVGLCRKRWRRRVSGRTAFDVGTGQQVTVDAPDLKIDEPTLVGELVEYHDVEVGVGLRYRVSNGSVKEEIVLEDATAAGRRYRFELSDPDGLLGDAVRVDGGGWQFTGAGEDEQPILQIPTPVSYELGDDQLPRFGSPLFFGPSAHVEVAKSKGGFTIESWVDPLWLEGREYPIALDPTFHWGWGRPNDGTRGYGPITHKTVYRQYLGCPAGPVPCSGSLDNGYLYAGSSQGPGYDNRALRSV